MVTSEIIQRVYLLKYGQQTATCFLITIQEKSYLITARHVFPDSIKSGCFQEFELFEQNWSKVGGNVLFHQNKEIDIAVIDLNQTGPKEIPYILDVIGMTVTQDCFFLGFPFGLKMNVPPEANQNFPIPFIKKGIISAWLVDGTGVFRIYLDGHNNPGFSGGPVVIRNQGSEKMSIIGIVSGYIPDSNPKHTPQGDIVTYENSGIVIVYAIKHVFDIIEETNKKPKK